MKRWLLTALLSFGLKAGYSQTITGKITDARTAEALPLVNIYAGENLGTTSNLNGEYLLQLKPGTYTLVFSFVGYETQKREVVLVQNQTLTIHIALKESMEMLETVVISAGKFEQRIEETTVSLEVIKPYLITNKNTLKLEETLNQTPGVHVAENQPNIRSGSGWTYGAGSRVMVMVDEMPLMSPDAMQVQWKLLPNETLLQTEVIKGAASALYGTSALNGVINFRTIEAIDKPQTGITLFSGFYDKPARESLKWWDGTRIYSGANGYHAQKIGKVNLVASAFLLWDPGYLYEVEDKRARINLKATTESQKIKGLSYGINSSVLYSKGGDVLLWQDYDNAYIPQDSSASVSKGWDYYIDPHITYRKNRTRQTVKGRFMGINNNVGTRTENYSNYSNFVYSEYQVQHLFDENTTVTGGLLGSWATSNSEIFQGLHSTTNMAAYAQADKKWNKFNASLGLRYESFRLNERVFNKPVLRAGLNYQAARGTWLRASYGGGFRFPSMAEQLTDTRVGIISVFPNPDILPEEGWSAELGVKQGVEIGSRWRGFVDLAAFIMRYDNMIEFSFNRWRNQPGGVFANSGFKSVNIGPTQITGAELTFTGQGKINELEMRILAGYTYMTPIALNPNEPYALAFGGNTPEPTVPVDFVSTSSNPENNILKYRYRHLAKADVQADYRQFGFGVSVRYNDFMQNIDALFEDPLFNLFVPGIKTARETLNKGDFFIDLRASAQINKTIRLSFIVDNLLNREFMPRPAAIGAPRRFTLQVQFVF